ncbi:MAG: diguanylate cyclase domain-containing protein [Candidatus Acidiferrales bacterium]
MPQPGEAFLPQTSAEDSFFDLLVETLEGLEEAARGQFLRQFFRTVAQIDLSETQSNEYWRHILQRRQEISERIGRRISLKTAIVDVLASTNILRVPILVEFEDFKKLQFDAATDSLTRLYNRRLFDEHCDKEMIRAKRYSQQLAIVIFDMHKLKDVNDRHGHLEGDRILQLVAATLRKTLRASDFAFRIGGDEFALLLPQTDPEQALTLCRRVRSQYEADLSPANLNIGVTVDFGIAVYPQDGDQKSELLSIADRRLYELKHAAQADARITPLPPPAHREPPPPAAAAPKLAETPAAPATAPAPSASGAPAAAPEHAHAERKWERVSLAGTKSHAILTDVVQTSARVLDLSYGGVALQFDRPEELPQQFNAVLHVPILPPVRVVLKKAYAQTGESGQTRVGCAFVS